MSLKLLIFDFDGVIVDSNAIKDEGFRRAFSKFPEWFDALWAYHKANPAVPRSAKFTRLATEFLKLPDPAPFIQAEVDEYTRYTRGRIIECPWIRGAQRLLEELYRSVPLYLVSATPHDELERIVAARGLSPYFRKIYGNPQVKAETLRQILVDENVQPGECLFVGDSLSDLRSARQAGVPFAGIVGESTFQGEECPLYRDLEAFRESLAARLPR
jgi:phosphoglycolate phosphatase-like HAD superfamily hydrolase